MLRKSSTGWWKYGALLCLAMLILELKVYDITKNDTADCAILLFGLPRAFRSLVLPSLIRNVIPFNDCDYYVHYYYQTEETAGRSGQGGSIDPNDIRQLEHAVLTYGPNGRNRRVEFAFDTEDDFWKRYGNLIEKIRNTKVEGKYLYFPYKAKTYNHPTTTDNIIKMWHSIQSAWNLMESRQKQKYAKVAMIRSDVVYLTNLKLRDETTVTIPGFGRHPVSDRAIYGKYDAVRIWATQRLPRLDQHVQWIQQNDPGWGMHSERFMNYTIFPDMRDILKEDPHWCFLRARADESVWVRDCEISALSSINVGNVRTAVETAIGRPCPGNITKITQRFRSLSCAKAAAPVG